MKNITDEVMALVNIGIAGNVIPDSWYQIITYDSGKPNLNAIVILADILYWYRPIIVRDEMTGKIKGYEKKFKADILQMGYSQINNKFGLTKRQAKDSLTLLEKLGFIQREVRTVTTKDAKYGNVLFIRLDSKKIIDSLKLVEPTLQQSDTLVTSKSDPSDIETPPSVVRSTHLGTQKYPPRYTEVLNTNTTTETTTENTTFNTAKIKNLTKTTKKKKEVPVPLSAEELYTFCIERDYNYVRAVDMQNHIFDLYTNGDKYNLKNAKLTLITWMKRDADRADTVIDETTKQKYKMFKDTVIKNIKNKMRFVPEDFINSDNEL